RIPRGTVANIDADYNRESDGNAKIVFSGDRVRLLITSSTPGTRPGWRFPLSALPTATVNDVTFQVNVVIENIEAGDLTHLNAYDSDGQADPESDDAATFYTNCGGTTLVTDNSEFHTTGSKIIDLGVTATGQVEGNIGSPDRWSLGMTATYNIIENVHFEAIE